MPPKKHTFLVVTFLSTCLYIYTAFFLSRDNFLAVAIIWFSLFAGYYYYLKVEISQRISWILMLLFRLIFLVSVPVLSQDFYRFIWDGNLLINSFNPYLTVPEFFINHQLLPFDNTQLLYKGMGQLNGSHYSNYPPVNQLNFALAAFFGGTNILSNIIFLRLQIILADIGIIYFGSQILKKLKLNQQAILFYALNPLVIIELTGNLHFEAVMLFFLVVSFHFLLSKKNGLAALFFSFSIGTKLIPILLLPLLFPLYKLSKKESFKDIFQFDFRKLIQFYSITFIATLFLFLPFYNHKLIENYWQSIDLWFHKFEFNASFYYLFREIGYLFRGYNEIQLIGSILPVFTILCVIYLTFFKNVKSIKTIFNGFLIALTCYYFFSTTIHPWYLSNLIIWSCFTKYRYPVIWSLMIVVSYQAYSNYNNNEYLALIFLEYIIVIVYLCSELGILKKSLTFFNYITKKSI